MRKSHIAIFSIPGPVHVYPTLSMVATLIRRGYRATYVTSERFAPELMRLGAEVLRIPRVEYPYNQDTDETLPIEKQYSTTAPNLAARTLALVSPFLERYRPDLVLYDGIAFAGLLLAEKLGVRSVRMSPQLAFDDENLTLPICRADHVEQLKNLKKRISDFVRHAGSKHTHDIAFGWKVPTVYFYTRQLQLNPGRVDAQSLYAGRCAAERPSQGVWKPEGAADKKTVLVSGSTAILQGTEYYKSCLTALSGLGWKIVLGIGLQIDPQSLAPLPPDVQIIQNVPQTLILPHADAMICLGGMATTMEAMYHGVPLLMLTHGFSEGETYADNVQNHGLGIHLRGVNVTADAIRDAFEKLISKPDIRSQVARMQATIKRDPGGEEVVNWLEERCFSGTT